MTQQEFLGKRALVTGATAGIGRATAQLLAEAGASVVVTGRDRDRGAATVETIRRTGGDARFVAADLSDLASVRSLAQEAGEVDVLVHNAGVFPFASTFEQSPETYEQLFGVNVRGPYFLTAALGRAMARKGSGSIVNVSSIYATAGAAGTSVYSATKGALTALTRAWAAEFGANGVRVNAVAPGPTRTEGLADLLDGDVDSQAKNTLLNKVAEPSEVAEAIVFLASERASFITGVLLAVDGGMAAM